MENIKIHARDCIVAEVSNEETKTFLNENHSQKSAKIKFAYGLYYNGELVQLLALGKPRFNDNYKYEIIRDCTKRGFQINGGVSKIWNFILEKIKIMSCICYSYPHNGELTNKYIDYCGFKNIKKSKPEKKSYFEGIWNNELKRIDKSLLEKQGVDRLLQGEFGQDRTNEQILLDLGFEKKYEDGYSPQIDIYYPFGLLYRIDDLDDGAFYIGMTERKEEWENGYIGSGSSKWRNHLEKHPVRTDDCDNPYAHSYKRTILSDNFKTPKELRDAEVEEIRKYCSEIDGKYVVADPKCKNHKTTNQNTIHNMPTCEECGGKNGHHHSGCSQYKIPKGCCPHCGTPAGGMHKKTCPNFSETICPECGGKNSQHKKSCSQYKTRKTCPECGSSTIHLKTCSHYKEIASCPECGGIDGKHKRTCSKFKATICPECGGRSGRHKTTCSKAKFCEECGELSPNHKQYCNKYSSKTCPECGGKRGHHKSDCSKAKKCEICGSPIGHHTPECPINKRCPECGSLNGKHKKTCSHATVCPECGGMKGQHTKECSHSKVCPECGYSTQSRTHAKTCSHYKERSTRQPCPECGTTRGHKKTCSKYKRNLGSK